MTSVWYVGTANKMTITVADWARVGITAAADSVWDSTNGYSIPTTSFTSQQLTALANEGAGRFNVSAPDGARPGASGTPVDLSGQPVTLGYFNTVNAGVQAFMKKQKGSNGPLHRQRNNFRRLGPVTADVTGTTNTAAHDATLSKMYLTPVTGLSSGQVRKMTDAEYAAAPYMQYPDTGSNPRIWNNSGFGYVMPCPSSLSIDETYQFPNVTQQRFEVMTDAPVIEFAMYAYLGLSVTSMQVYVDGSPVTLAPVACAGALTYYKITFASGKKPRLVELVTEALLTQINIAPLYKTWKPPKRRGPKLMIVGASYVQPLMYDSTTGAATFYRYGHWQQMDAYADIDQLVVEGIGGTGFVTPAASGVGYPNNKYTDRVQGILNTKPDIIVFADAFSNDLHASASTASIITAVKQCCDTIWAALPDTRIVFQTGLRTPVYGDFTSSYDTIKAALKAYYPGKPMYWIDVRNVIDQTSGYAGPGSSVTANTTASNTAIVSTAGPSLLTLVGSTITGSGISAGTKLQSASDATHGVMTANATATATGVALNFSSTLGLGNTDFYLGNDAVHPTKEGSDYLRGWLYPAIQKVLWDDGTLYNTELV